MATQMQLEIILAENCIATGVLQSRDNKRESIKTKMHDISSIKPVTKKLLEVTRCSRAKQRGKEIYRKSVLHVQSCFC